MTTSTDSAAGSGLPYAPHDSGMALGGLLAFSAAPLAANPSTRLSGHAFEAERHSYLAIPDDPDMEPAFSAAARFRWQIEEEIERLIGVLDALDGDPDFEPAGDELEPSDNGLADEDALQEQLFLRPRAIGHRTGSYGDRL